MKLATKYQRSNLLVTLILFLLASVAFYLLLHRVLIFQMDEDLEIEQREIENYARRFGKLPENVIPVEDQIVTARRIRSGIVRPIRRTVVLTDPVEHASGKFRQLVFSVRTDEGLFEVSVSKSMDAVLGLHKLIVLIALGTIALMLLVSFVVNRMVLRRLWKPFYKTITRMQKFELDKKFKVLPQVPVEEFDLLNKTLQAVTRRAANDYRLLKEFTENASHELQTPLAIIRSKLDLLIQDEQLSDHQSAIIQDAYEALNRMTHLNQSLLMLAKIEGGQYAERASVDVKSLLEERLVLFQSFIQEKGLILEQHIDPSSLLVHPALAEILLNNLLSNAIDHSNANGRMVVTLTADQLQICNTSASEELRQAGLFSRFYKTSAGATRTGLGLAIAKQICDVSGCSISYQYDAKGMHCFRVDWGSLR